MAPKVKKSSSSGSNHTFNINDVVLAKMSGYPFWPALVVDETKVPSSVLKQKRPGSKIVQFMPQADYGFVSGKDMKPLSKDAIEAFLAEPARAGKGKLHEAYQTAQKAEEWIKVAEDAAREREEFERQQAEAEDELEEEDDGQPAKKRKSVNGAKAVKKNGAAKKKGDGKKAETGKKRKADGAAKDDDDDKDELDPASKKVKSWRHELQRIFFGKEGILKDKLGDAGALFGTLEKYDEMTQKQLADSKIIKVLKKIISLKPGEIPQEAEDEHKFKERSEKLVNKWQEILNGKPSSTPAASSAAVPEVGKTESTTAQDAPAAATTEAAPADDAATEEKKEPEAAAAAPAA